MRGNITRRGKCSWRIKFELEPRKNGKRKTRYITVRGKRQDAEKELTRLLSAADAGTLVDPSNVTVAEHILSWFDGAHGLTPKTAERYRQLAEQQIFPHLGAIVLQKLKPAAIQIWHDTLISSGGKDGKPLAARTVGHAHRVLHKALQRAVENETLVRNVARVIRPPKVEDEEVQILDPEQIATVFLRLDGHPLHPIAFTALATGLRRGELLALQLGDFDLDGASLKVERALEETKNGLRFKPPKTKHGRRVISLPPTTVVLRAHRLQQLEVRLALGLGKPARDTLVFSTPDGSPLSPDNLSRDWKRAVVALGLPQVTFHALRHTHASALIARGGGDVVTISRRLGHSSPVVTLKIYAHPFANTDTAAASAIEAVLRTVGERGQQ
jgi:integrase